MQWSRSYGGAIIAMSGVSGMSGMSGKSGESDSQLTPTTSVKNGALLLMVLIQPNENTASMDENSAVPTGESKLMHKSGDWTNVSDKPKPKAKSKAKPKAWPKLKPTVTKTKATGIKATIENGSLLPPALIGCLKRRQTKTTTPYGFLDRKIHETLGMKPTQLVGKTIKVEFDIEGELKWFIGEVRSYQQGVHTVFYPEDGTFEEQNFFDPEGPGYIGTAHVSMVE